MTVAATPTVQLDVFEGPLDLLLHLIKKNEVSITDIPIATITDQYLAAIEAGRDTLNLDGAGEYLVMAATLTFIKSRMLLPQPADSTDDQDEDPRAELVQRLLEYQRYREVAVALGARPILERDVFLHPPTPVEPAPADEPQAAPVRDASLGDLLVALRELLARRTPPRAHEIDRPHTSVAACVHTILERFAAGDAIEFTTLFPPDAGRADVIVMFLALLELIKLRVVNATQAERFGSIELRLAVADIGEAAERVRDVGAEAWGGGVHGYDGTAGTGR